MKAGIVEMLAPPDFIAFGLVLHISIINELEHLSPAHQTWKTVNNGISVIFIALYRAAGRNSGLPRIAPDGKIPGSQGP